MDMFSAISQGIREFFKVPLAAHKKTYILTHLAAKSAEKNDASGAAMLRAKAEAAAAELEWIQNAQDTINALLTPEAHKNEDQRALAKAIVKFWSFQHPQAAPLNEREQLRAEYGILQTKFEDVTLDGLLRYVDMSVRGILDPQTSASAICGIPTELYAPQEYK